MPQECIVVVENKSDLRRQVEAAKSSTTVALRKLQKAMRPPASTTAALALEDIHLVESQTVQGGLLAQNPDISFIDVCALDQERVEFALTSFVDLLVDSVESAVDVVNAVDVRVVAPPVASEFVSVIPPRSAAKPTSALPSPKPVVVQPQQQSKCAPPESASGSENGARGDNSDKEEEEHSDATDDERPPNASSAVKRIEPSSDTETDDDAKKVVVSADESTGGSSEDSIQRDMRRSRNRARRRRRKQQNITTNRSNSGKGCGCGCSLM
jgi:hypothetical protein